MTTARPAFRVRLGTTAAVMCTGAVIVVLAVMQYRWNQAASDATGVRLADSLQLSMINWHLDLFRNLAEVGLTMRAPIEGPRSDVEQYGDRLQEWRSLARYPALVSDVYVVRPGAGGRPQVVPLSTGVPIPAAREWPAVIARVVPQLERGGAAAGQNALGERRRLTESFYNIGAALEVWRFDASAPALVRAMPSSGAWLVVALDGDVIRERILPDLARRYFQGTDGLDYEVAVVSPGPPRRVIYTSDKGFGSDNVSDADGRMDVFGRATGGSGSTVQVFHRTSSNTGPAAAVGVSWFPLLGDAPVSEDWQLLVRHRRGGPLGSFVAQMRLRGIIGSFAALFVLVLSLSMLLVTTLRAQRLAQLQMDFVTTVSHELRTPLTIIGAAADNITSGVIENQGQLREYGTIIGEETSRLAGLVERILRFAAIRDGRQAYVLEPLSPSAIIEAVLNGTSALVKAAHVTVERRVPADLPLVLGDRMAVSQCLENLVTNALKYGQQARWIGIEAHAPRPADGTVNGDAVAISVSDRGLGIGPEDLPHIFEPFYRSRSPQIAAIHGTGLGLAVAKQMAEATGGTLSVQSALGAGSTFTLTLRRHPGAVPPA